MTSTPGHSAPGAAETLVSQRKVVVQQQGTDKAQPLVWRCWRCPGGVRRLPRHTVGSTRTGRAR